MSKTEVKWPDEKAQMGKFGIWTSFLSSFGIGIDAGVKHKSKLSMHYTFERMETSEFRPSAAYLQEQTAVRTVVACLQKHRFSNSVYVVTAIKTVHGVTGSSGLQRSTNVDLKAGVSGALTGARLAIGSDQGYSYKRDEQPSFRGASDFVFAFRLRRVIVTKKGIKDRHFGTGAIYDLYEEDEGEEQSLPFKVNGIDEEDSTAQDHGTSHFRDVLDDVDEETCACSFASRG